MMKNCLDCPSLLQPMAARAFFGKDIGVPVCARFGKPVGTVTSSPEQRAKIGGAIAKNCAEYGSPPPQNPNWEKARFTVTLPDPEVMRFNRKTSQAQVRSCATCEHFVREDVVLSELGFGVGLCSAKGNLLLPHRLGKEALGCEERSLALSGVRTNVTGLMMLPEYSPEFSLSADPVKHHQQMKANFIDPVDYPSDFPVSATDEAEGIRAWRKVEDPITGNFTKLPIFRLDFFSPEDQARIPRTGDDEHPEDYVDYAFNTYKVAVLWRELDETPAAWGQAGVGKTEFSRYMAWMMCLPFIRISVKNSTEVDDLAGKMRFHPEKGTYWEDGRVASAWSKPCVLNVDEPNTGMPEVQQFFRPMFDNSKQLVLDENAGEERDRNDHCYPFLAMNPAWDMRNVGAHEISDADANRLMHLYFDLPPERLEREILTTACAHDGYKITPQTLDTVMKIATDIRALSEEGTVPITWGIRPQLKVARATRWFDLITCYRMAVADFLDPAQQTQILDVVKSHVQ